MSNPRLPREILDYTVDLLHDKQDALKQCCLVSKSWAPRTRKHLFARINFNHPDDLKAWKKTFPDPANSPAYHTRSLLVGCPRFVTVADAEEGGWIRAFSRVIWFELRTDLYHHPEISLVPFHNFSPALKSLRVINSLPRPRVFNLVCSLLLLENLTIRELRIGEADYDGIDFQPSTPPLLTGPFGLYSGGGTEPTARRLLDLPGGFRFRKLVLTWRDEEDIRWIMALVVGCSHTLECFDIRQTIRPGKQQACIDLSKATRLKNVIFRYGGLNPRWIVMALQTITSKHRDLQRITIRTRYHRCPSTPESVNLRVAAGEDGYRQWMDLDSLLVQLLESHAIRTKVTRGGENSGKKSKMCKHLRGLLPKVAESGTVQPVVCSDGGSTARSEDQQALCSSR